MTELQQAQSEANKYKQMLPAAQNRAAQSGMLGNSPAVNLDAAPAPAAQAPLVHGGVQAEPRLQAAGPNARSTLGQRAHRILQRLPEPRAQTRVEAGI